MPRIPFSDWIQTFTSSGRNEGASVGIPGKSLISSSIYDLRDYLTNSEVNIVTLLEFPSSPLSDSVP